MCISIFTEPKIKRLLANEYRSALHGTFRFGFAGVRNAPNIELGLFKHKERARESPLGFSQAPIEQKKTQQTPFAQPTWLACCCRPCLGSLAVLDLDGSASSCSLERGSWSSTNSAKRSIFRSQMPVYCYSAQAPSKTLHYTIHRG